MKFQCIAPRSITVKGRRTEYKVGQRISESAYLRLSKTMQSGFLPARQAVKKSPYLVEEVTFIIHEYIRNDSRIAVCEEFQKQFPNNKHTADSIMMTVCLLENLDNTKDGQDGSVYHLTEHIVKLAQDLYPDRFNDPSIDSKIDSLLAQIRG